MSTDSPHEENQPDADDLAWADVPTREKVLVIGAGPAGLAMAAALRALRMPFDLVDEAKDVGGIWAPGREDSPVWPALEMVSSTRFTQYEDLLQPVSFPPFLAPGQMSKYLRAYAAHNHLTDHFQPRTTVRSARPFEEGVWQVEFSTGQIAVYRAVVAAHGTSAHPYLPPSASRFPSSTRVVHSSEWTGNAGLEGKRVLVVGGGQSGADVAVDAARRALEVRWSVRSGHWIVPRTIGNVPGDVAAAREPELLGSVNDKVARGVIGRSVGTPTDLGLPTPKAPLLQDRVIISDELAPRIRDGRITPVGDVGSIDADGDVTFSGGDHYLPDVVVFATGYELGADFLPDELVPRTASGSPDLFLGAFPRSRDDLVLLGQQGVSGGILPLLVEQADVAAYFLRAAADGSPAADAFRRLRAGSDASVPLPERPGLRGRLDSLLGSRASRGPATASSVTAVDEGRAAPVPFVDREESLARLRTARALFE